MPRILLTVTNDLTYDQRMQRICTTLADADYEVQLIGRKLPNSKPIRDFPFEQKRLYCYFKKGKLFYLEYNIRLFFYLLFAKTDAVCAIDLDTILPAFFTAKLRQKKFIYDAHEYFTEVPEVVDRPRIQKVWERIARLTIPRTSYAYTVCDSLAEIFENEYGTAFSVIRNAPIKRLTVDGGRWTESKLMTNHQPPIILYQGALNDGRGVAEAIEAMQEIEEAELWLAGEGDLSQELRELAEKLKVTDRVKFLGYVEPADLHKLTPQATIGLNLLENKGLNYYYALSNKFLDYIQADVPSINMDYPETRKILDQYEVGLALDNLETKYVVSAIKRLLSDKKLYNKLKLACKEAAKVYVWEEEEKELIAFYKGVFSSEK